jgi:hypothetical protein
MNERLASPSDAMIAISLSRSAGGQSGKAIANSRPPRNWKIIVSIPAAHEVDGAVGILAESRLSLEKLIRDRFVPCVGSRLIRLSLEPPAEELPDPLVICLGQRRQHPLGLRVDIPQLDEIVEDGRHLVGPQCCEVCRSHRLEAGFVKPADVLVLRQEPHGGNEDVIDQPLATSSLCATTTTKASMIAARFSVASACAASVRTSFSSTVREAADADQFGADRSQPRSMTASAPVPRRPRRRRRAHPKCC